MLKLAHRQITQTEVKKKVGKTKTDPKSRPQMITDVKALNRQCH